jgi:hypothetical protein
MIRRQKIRSRFRVANCLLVFLAVFVFNWGLQYKLSLYKASEAVKPTMPAAKLLAGEELAIWGPAPVRLALPAPILCAPFSAIPVAGNTERPTVFAVSLVAPPASPRVKLRRIPPIFSRPPPQNT